MSWHYSQELEAAYSEGTCSDGEQCVPLKKTPSAVRFSSDASWMDSYRRSLSGTMSARSTEGSGAGASMSSVVGFPARTFPPLGVEPALRDHVPASGHTWHESSARYDRATSTWRTHRCLFEEDLPWSSVTLPRLGMMLGGVCWGLTIAERPTGESEFGSWPTQTEREPKLSEQVKYPTPRMSDYRGAVSKTDCTARLVENGQANLPEFVQELGGHQIRQTWPTPRAFMHKYSKHDRGKHNLGEVVWTTPCASDTAHRKQKYSQGGTPTSMQAGGALNPDWTEWLMAWPIGWTALKPLGMARFRQWLRLHGVCLEDQSDTVRIKEGE